MDKKYDFSLSYEALTRVCENAICEHIRRAGSLEGLGFALEYTKAYAILDGMVSAGSYWRYISSSH
ncbi:TPA: hypothetical protein ACXRXR_004268 [Klebsiella pneumoniae]|uniref:hypothetical protein n=1 Tax=Klebsiella pneumoniae TaxID=573 RepID=UPI000DE604B5|nr:hypothetical protein [Klebsiella pneumoniae]MCM5729998.1 hypothetical protein [Klebsiella pneumoniae]MDW1179218.1 hypothetical protein [Klebsiella pneumoniae]WKU60747.1 hypothetical protein Q3W73_28080 [Klebsiella pneumoniae]SSJ32663.1 Uncharacterised protein [Klebsiella pneumoniae]